MKNADIRREKGRKSLGADKYKAYFNDNFISGCHKGQAFPIPLPSRTIK